MLESICSFDCTLEYFSWAFLLHHLLLQHGSYPDSKLQLASIVRQSVKSYMFDGLVAGAIQMTIKNKCFTHLYTEEQ